MPPLAQSGWVVMKLTENSWRLLLPKHAPTSPTAPGSVGECYPREVAARWKVPVAWLWR